jgi:hypothetical protein
MIGLVLEINAHDLIERIPDAGKDKIGFLLCTGAVKELVIIGMFAEDRHSLIIQTEFSTDSSGGGVGKLHKEISVPMTDDHFSPQPIL